MLLILKVSYQRVFWLLFAQFSESLSEYRTDMFLQVVSGWLAVGDGLCDGCTGEIMIITGKVRFSLVFRPHHTQIQG